MPTETSGSECNDAQDEEDLLHELKVQLLLCEQIVKRLRDEARYQNGRLCGRLLVISLILIAIGLFIYQVFTGRPEVPSAYSYLLPFVLAGLLIAFAKVYFIDIREIGLLKRQIKDLIWRNDVAMQIVRATMSDGKSNAPSS